MRVAHEHLAVVAGERPEPRAEPGRAELADVRTGGAQARELRPGARPPAAEPVREHLHLHAAPGGGDERVGHPAPHGVAAEDVHLEHHALLRRRDVGEHRLDCRVAVEERDRVAARHLRAGDAPEPARERRGSGIGERDLGGDWRGERGHAIFQGMLPINLAGKRALVAGVADDGGFGFAIAKCLAMAGASVSVATWPPALTIFRNLLERGKIDASRRMPDGSLLEFERIYPLDAVFDTLDDAPAELRESKRYKDTGDFSIGGLAAQLVADFGERPLDIVVHSLANGPEVKKPLLEVSRGGYLSAVSASAYSMVSMLQRLGPLMRPGGSLVSLTYMASERAIPGYGGGMSSAKAALESDTRTLAFEAGRAWGVRVNTISAGPYASRAASAIGIIDRMVQYCKANAPLPEELSAMEVGQAAAFLSSPLASAITGHTLYVDKGYHAMGMAVAGWSDVGAGTAG